MVVDHQPMEVVQLLMVTHIKVATNRGKVVATTSHTTTKTRMIVTIQANKVLQSLVIRTILRANLSLPIATINSNSPTQEVVLETMTTRAQCHKVASLTQDLRLDPLFLLVDLKLSFSPISTS